MGNLEYRIQLKDIAIPNFGVNITSAGGLVLVCQQGSPAKQTIYDKNGAALANPLVPSRGFINFFIPDTVTVVDLYVQFPGGQFKVVLGVLPSGPNEISTDTSKVEQCFIIPFNIGDVTAGTEYNTQFFLPVKSLVLDRLHGTGINVTTAETTGAKTINVGTLSSETGGSASGFINASSTATAGQVVGTNGGLFTSNAPYLSDANIASHISYTLVTASVAAQGYIRMPYRLFGSQN